MVYRLMREERHQRRLTEGLRQALAMPGIARGQLGWEGSTELIRTGARRVPSASPGPWWAGSGRHAAPGRRRPERRTANDPDDCADGPDAALPDRGPAGAGAPAVPAPRERRRPVREPRSAHGRSLDFGAH